MKFLLLLKESVRYVLRARLPVLLLVFSFLLHYAGLSIVRNTTFSAQGIISSIGPREGMFVSIYLSLFMGVFLSAIYGIWMVPFFHQGERSLLTFVIPVSKWLYPVAYAVTFLGLVLLEFCILFGSFAWVFGKQALFHPWFSWKAVMTCLLIEAAALETTVFFFGFLSLVVGQIMTLFLMAGAFIVLQVAGTLFRFGLDHFSYELYEWLPPVGELIFNLKQTFSQGVFPGHHLVLWLLWLCVSICLFRVAIRRPQT
jgi:hypothetical protein